MLVHEGENAYLLDIFRKGGTVYMGLCNQTPNKTDTLASITTEPSVANGYARQPITLDASGFPDIEIVNNETRIVSAAVTFAAAGGDFDKSFTRAFLCSVASGSSGTLYGYSGAYSSAILLLDTQSKQLKWVFHP